MPPVTAAIETDARALDALRRQVLGVPLAIRELVRLQVRGGLNEAATWMIQQKLTGGTSATRLARRSGKLGDSIATEATVEGDGTVTGRLYVRDLKRFRGTSPSIYAPVHEFGATIVPRFRQWLTIPLIDEARKRAAPKIRGLFVIRSKAGNLLLVRREGKGIRPFFVLKKSVTIPARPFMAPTAARFFPLIIQNIAKALDAFGQRGGVTATITQTPHLN